MHISREYRVKKSGKWVYKGGRVFYAALNGKKQKAIQKSREGKMQKKFMVQI